MNRKKFLVRIVTALSTVPMWPRFILAQTPVENAENTQVWGTYDGKKVRIVDMTDDHLRNCIFYMHRVYATSVPFRVPDTYGGPGTMFPYYDVMRREADRRKLSWYAPPKSHS